MSKYFGESERLLGKVFSLANEIPNGAIIFLDEVLMQKLSICKNHVIVFSLQIGGLQFKLHFVFFPCVITGRFFCYYT